MDTKQADKLIQQYVESTPHRPGAADVRLTPFGVSVWAIIGYLRGVRGDVASTAAAFDVPTEAIKAASAYYERHREVIDARIAANAA